VPPPPRELVGKWNGGPDESGDWSLIIGPDGRYKLINDSMGSTDSGLVDTTNHGFKTYTATGDDSVLDAAGIQGCDWTIQQLRQGTFLVFCGWSSSWLPAN
jgi:hypothetical protein